MTVEQSKLLKRLYAGFCSAVKNNEPNHAYIEVGWINGVNPRTAQALIEKGLVIEDYPPSSTFSNESYLIRLPVPLPNEDPDRFSH